MDLGRLTTTDVTGRFYLQQPHSGGRFAGYYASLAALRPMLAGAAWQAAVTGYYLNVAGDFDAVRLTYLTTTPAAVRAVVADFAAANGLAQSAPPEPANPSVISGSYGGEELRFRRFLCTYPLIGLDLLAADALHARCLFATFRWQVMAARLPCRPHFAPTFERDSPYYRTLPAAAQAQWWADLAHWPNPPQVDWAHMLVNMILGCDWLGEWRSYFCQPQAPLSVAEINERVAEQAFAIPEGWRA